MRIYGPDIPSAFRRVFPQYDWSFLEGRRRILSEKALNNKRQAKEKAEVAAMLKRQKKNGDDGGSGGESTTEEAARLRERQELGLPSPLALALPLEILHIFSSPPVRDSIKECVPANAYSPIPQYLPTSSFSLIIDEREMDIPASDQIDSEQLVSTLAFTFTCVSYPGT